MALIIDVVATLRSASEMNDSCRIGQMTDLKGLREPMLVRCARDGGRGLDHTHQDGIDDLTEGNVVKVLTETVREIGTALTRGIAGNEALLRMMIAKSADGWEVFREEATEKCK